MPYIGQGLTEGRRRAYNFVATSNQTTFSATYDVGYVDVYQNGILLTTSDYTATNGSTVVLGVGASASDEITIIAHQMFSVSDTVSAAQGGSFSGAIDVTGNITTTGSLRGPSSFTIDPATHGDNTGTVVIAGDLTVNGTTTTINSTTLTVDDKNIILASGTSNSSTADGSGLTIDLGSDGTATMVYTHATTSIDFNKNVKTTGVISNTSGADASSASDLSGDFGTWMRVGDGVGNKTMSNGTGLKIADAGVVHWTVGQLAGHFKISKTSANKDQLFPSSRNDYFSINGSTGATELTKLDMNGGEVILDADADTSITADTDDTIDFKIGGIDAVKMVHGSAYTTQTLISTLDNSYASPVLNLYKNSTTPANWDYNGVLKFSANDSAGNETAYAQIIGRSPNVSNGSEEGSLMFYVAKNGSIQLNTLLYDTKVQFFREQTLEWYQHKGTTYTNVLDWATPTANRTITLPNATGTVAVTDSSGNLDISGTLAVTDSVTVLIADGGADNEYAMQIKNQEATDDRSYGLLIHAGSTNTDRALTINDHDGTTPLFYVAGNGNVGIGTTNPGAKLHIKHGPGGSTTEAFRIADDAGYTNVQMLSGAADGEIKIGAAGVLRGSYKAQFAGTATGHSFNIGTAGSNAITVDSSQRVGIGTTNPYKKLTLSASFGGSASDLLDLQSSASGGGTAPKIRFGTFSANSNTVGRIGFVDEPNYGGEFVVETNSSGGATDTTTEKFRIDKDGNVGIGTNDPTTGLDMYGAGNIPRIKLRESSGNQLNIGLWDGSNYRIEGDSSRPILITSYHSNGVAIGGSGATNMQVSTGGVDFNPNSGGSFNFKGNGGAQLSIRTSQYTGGSGTSIGTSNVQVVNSAFGALVFVAGYGNGQFCDLVYFGYNASPTIIAQQTIAGSPPSRIYTGSGYALYLRYSSGSLTTKVNCIQSHS